MKTIPLSAMCFVLFVALGAVLSLRLRAGEIEENVRYQVLAPIQHGNLMIFPVTSTHVHDTSQFLSLEEGLRSGEVVITESGNTGVLVRPRQGW